MRPAGEERPDLLYVLTSLENGGAEWGLLALLDGGAFAGCRVSVAVLVRGPGAQLQALAERGVEIRVLSPAARVTPAALLRAGLGLARLLRRQPGWGAVVLSLPHANILGRLLAPRGRGRPLVLSFEHNERLARPLYARLYRLTAGRVDWLLADCATTLAAAVAARHRRPPPAADVLPLVRLGPERFHPHAAVDAGPPYRWVAAGRLSEAKDHAWLLDLAAAVRERGVPVHLTLYGEGPMRPALERRIAELGLEGRVELPGRVEGWWRRPAHLVLSASRREGLCIAAVEAMAAGLPLAARPAGALADYGPQAGMLALSGELAADAAAVSALLNDAPRRERMAQAGRAVAEERYGRAAADAVLAGFSDRLGAALRARRPGATPYPRAPARFAASRGERESARRLRPVNRRSYTRRPFGLLAAATGEGGRPCSSMQRSPIRPSLRPLASPPPA